MPTLAEVPDYPAPLDVDITPKIKDFRIDMGTGEVDKLVTAVKRRQMTRRTFVQSFNPTVFARVNRAAPALTTVYLAHGIIRVTALKKCGADIASVNMNRPWRCAGADPTRCGHNSA